MSLFTWFGLIHIHFQKVNDEMAAAEGLLSSLERLNLAEKSAIALEKVEENYILDVAVQNKYVCPFI